MRDHVDLKDVDQFGELPLDTLGGSPLDFRRDHDAHNGRMLGLGR